jgi:hypothetical protein
LLASLGEYYFAELVSQEGGGDYVNLFIHDFVVENDFVYVVGYDVGSAENDLQVFVLDAADFSTLSLVGKYAQDDLAVAPESVTLEVLKVGDYLYVASQGNGLFVIDVSDPAAPSGELLFPGSPFTAMALADQSTMYVAWEDPLATGRRIHVVDIEDPAAPQLLGSFGDDLPVFDMLYVDGMLYVYGPGIVAFDASVPTSPVLRDQEMFPGSSLTTVAYSNGFIYAPITDSAAGLQGLTVVDARDPQNLERVHDVPGLGLVTEVDVSGQTLYATASMGFGSSFTLLSFEIGTDGGLELADSRSTPAAWRLKHENDRVYLADALLFTAYAADALIKKAEPFKFIATDKSANLVEVVNGVAFVANDTELVAIDVSDPAGALTILDELAVIDFIYDMKIVGNYAYLANSVDGIKIVDISDPSDLRVVGNNGDLAPFENPENGETAFRPMVSIAVKNGLAYMVVGSFPYIELGVFAVEDPTAPTVVHAADFPYPITTVAVRNDTLYGVDSISSASLYVVDIEGAPAHVTTLDVNARALELVGTDLYTTSSSAGLSVFDVSADRNAIAFGSASSLGIGNAISVAGTLAYVASEFGSVEVYDVLDKTQPKLVAHYPINGVVKDVFATEDYVYAVNGLGLVIEPAARLHEALE